MTRHNPGVCKRGHDLTAPGVASKRGVCTICRKPRQADADKRYRTQRTVRQRSQRLRDLGWTLEHRAAVLAAQGGRCAICSTELDNSHRGPRSVCVDHCHVSGKARAILCRRCNSGLGMFGDDPQALRMAAVYLERFKA